MSSVSVHPPGNKVVTSSQMWHNAIFRFKRGLQVSSYKQVSENEERFFFFPPLDGTNKNLNLSTL